MTPFFSVLLYKVFYYTMEKVGAARNMMFYFIT